jgi:rRNA maturation endonuclease Nob1
MRPPRYTSKTHKPSQGVAKALHESNKENFDAVRKVSKPLKMQRKALKTIGKDEGISFDALTERTKPVAKCEKCGKPLELDLWQHWVCGHCGGWRV